MKSLSVLKRESEQIQGNIRVMLSENSRFDHNLAKKDVISDVNSLRNKLAVIQRELRERLSA